MIPYPVEVITTVVLLAIAGLLVLMFHGIPRRSLGPNPQQHPLPPTRFLPRSVIEVGFFYALLLPRILQPLWSCDSSESVWSCAGIELTVVGAAMAAPIAIAVHRVVRRRRSTSQHS